MFVQALEEALQNSNPLDASSKTLQDIWKHQVSFLHHHSNVFLMYVLVFVLFELGEKTDTTQMCVCKI